MPDTILPISPDLLRKRAAIPEKIAELSYRDRDQAIHYLRIWGEHRMPITPLFAELEKALSKAGEAV